MWVNHNKVMVLPIVLRMADMLGRQGTLGRLCLLADAQPAAASTSMLCAFLPPTGRPAGGGGAAHDRPGRNPGRFCEDG